MSEGMPVGTATLNECDCGFGTKPSSLAQCLPGPAGQAVAVRRALRSRDVSSFPSAAARVPHWHPWQRPCGCAPIAGAPSQRRDSDSLLARVLGRAHDRRVHSKLRFTRQARSRTDGLRTSIGTHHHRDWRNTAHPEGPARLLVYACITISATGTDLECFLEPSYTVIR